VRFRILLVLVAALLFPACTHHKYEAEWKHPRLNKSVDTAQILKLQRP
jgi:hypothetical protein